MYKIIENGKAKKTMYQTYEEARQVIRKYLRNVTPMRHKNQPDTNMGDWGFSIKKVCR